MEQLKVDLRTCRKNQTYIRLEHLANLKIRKRNFTEYNFFGEYHGQNKYALYIEKSSIKVTNLHK